MNEEQYNELSDLADKFFSQFDNDIKLIKTCDFVKPTGITFEDLSPNPEQDEK